MRKSRECRLGAVAVVGHGQDLAGPATVDDRREALDRLRRAREGDPVGGSDGGARRWSLGERVGRQDGPPDEPRLVTARDPLVVVVGERREGGERRQRRQLP